MRIELTIGVITKGAQCHHLASTITTETIFSRTGVRSRRVAVTAVHVTKTKRTHHCTKHAYVFYAHTQYIFLRNISFW